MAADDHFTRVDILKQKDHIYRIIGHERAENYFQHLNNFLSSKLSKAEFDKILIQTIGRGNISLHNRLIRSILHNACQATTPPRKAQKVEARSTAGYQKSYLQSLYGDAFPQSPRKCRSLVSRDRKLRDRPSPLGPLGKSPSLTVEETVSRLQEQPSAAFPLGFASVEEGEEVEQVAVEPSFQRWSSITAPLGVSFNSGVDDKGLHSCSLQNRFDETCQSSGELPDTRTLGRRLQKKLASEGLGISLDCAELLNRSLDVYLKRIISHCLGISGSRSADPFIGRRESNGQMVPGFGGNYAANPAQPTYPSMLDSRVAMETNPPFGKMMPGFNGNYAANPVQPTNVSMLDSRVALEKYPSFGQMMPGFNGNYVANPAQPTYANMLDSRVAMETNPSFGQMVPGFNGNYAANPVQPTHISMLDFRTAMETNPSLLGQDWSTQLERIYNYDLQ